MLVRFGDLEDWGIFWALEAEFHGDFYHEPLDVVQQQTMSNVDNPVAMRLQETINVVRLEEFLDNISDRHKLHRAKQLLRRHVAEGKRFGNFSTISVSYARRHTLPGRLYANGASIQNLPAGARKVALEIDIGSSANASPKNFDIDIENCFPRLLWNVLEEELGESVNIEYDIFTNFVQNPKDFRKFLAKALGISVKEAKKSIIKTLFWGSPQYELPLLWALAIQMRTASLWLLDRPDFQDLQQMFGDRAHPQATRLFYALSSFEDTIVGDIHKRIQAQLGEAAEVTTYMFDGLIVRVNIGDSEALYQILHKVSADYRVILTADEI